MKATSLRECTDLYLSLLTVRNFSKGTLRKLLYIIIEIYISYSSRRFIAVLELSAQSTEQKKNVMSSLDEGWMIIPTQ